MRPQVQVEVAASDGVGTGRLLADFSLVMASMRHALLSMIGVLAVGWLVAKIVFVFLDYGLYGFRGS